MFFKICTTKQINTQKSLRFRLKSGTLPTFCSQQSDVFAVTHSPFVTLPWPDVSCHRLSFFFSTDISSLSSLLAFCFRTHCHCLHSPKPCHLALPMGTTIKALGAHPSLLSFVFYQLWCLSAWPCVACGTHSSGKLWDTVFPVADVPCSVCLIILGQY